MVKEVSRKRNGYFSPTIVVIWIVIAAVIFFSVYERYNNKKVYIAAGNVKSKAMAQILGENTSGILQIVDLGLISVLEKIDRENFRKPEIQEKILETARRQFRFLPPVKNIVLFDSVGELIGMLGGFEIAGIESFKDHQQAWLDFSIKTESLARDQKKWIVMSRRIENLEGVFLGVIAAVIDPDFLFNRYENYMNIDVDAVALLDVHENLINVWQYGNDYSFFDFFQGLNIAGLTGGGSKTQETSGTIISAYRLKDFPFQISVLFKKQLVLQDWYEKMQKDLVIISALVLTGVIITLMAFGQRKKRRKAEDELMEYQQQLEHQVKERTLSLEKTNNMLAAEIEERKRADEKFRVAFKTSPDAICINRLEDGVYLDINEGFTNILGYSRQEILNRRLNDLNIWNESEKRDFMISELKRKGVVENFKAEFRKKEGCRVYGMMSARIVQIDNVEVILSITKDITRILETEERLRQAQKMEAIGTLAGGIAHDFNNILFPLIGFTEMLKEDLPQDSPLQENISQIYQAGLRAKDLVRQILSFSRQGEQQLMPLKIQLIVKEALKLLRSSIPKTIDIRTNISKDCGMVLADPTHIHQVIMNLSTNAYHAMKKNGGVLTVTLEQIDSSIFTGDHTFSALLPGDYALLKVSDTGEGIKRELMEKIFDPYFTTKPQGEGTGLGLSVVQSIVRGYGGDIRVSSELEKGTIFQVLLPIVKSAMSLEDIGFQQELPRGSERILLVDDEDVVVRMEKLMIERLGYQVSTEIKSIDALHKFRRNPEDFDLIITDMTMPNMTGVQLAREIREIRKNIPIIICTGFSDQVSTENIKAFGIDGFVMKPVAMRDLAQKIREVLTRNCEDNV